jgi:hypothetical protein
MENKNYSLILEDKSSLEEVVTHLTEQKLGTAWAEKSNGWAIDYIKHLGEVYGDSWYTGFLPKNLFMEILVPKHNHSEHPEDGNLLFPDDTPILKTCEYYKHPTPGYSQDCLELISYLRNEIHKQGFNTNVVLAVINGTLKHVDGLHRMIALSLLLEEVYEYKPIPVFLCDDTRKQ